MSRVHHDSSSEDRMVREYQITGFACRQLADWALAHFGERTEPGAYQRIVVSLANTGPDMAVDKVFRDLTGQGFNYRSEAVWRMYERFRIEGETRYPVSQTRAA